MSTSTYSRPMPGKYRLRTWLRGRLPWSLAVIYPHHQRHHATSPSMPNPIPHLLTRAGISQRIAYREPRSVPQFDRPAARLHSARASYAVRRGGPATFTAESTPTDTWHLSATRSTTWDLSDVQHPDLEYRRLASWAAAFVEG